MLKFLVLISTFSHSPPFILKLTYHFQIWQDPCIHELPNKPGKQIPRNTDLVSKVLAYEK